MNNVFGRGAEPSSPHSFGTSVGWLSFNHRTCESWSVSERAEPLVATVYFLLFYINSECHCQITHSIVAYYNLFFMRRPLPRQLTLVGAFCSSTLLKNSVVQHNLWMLQLCYFLVNISGPLALIDFLLYATWHPALWTALCSPKQHPDIAHCNSKCSILVSACNKQWCFPSGSRAW